MHFFKYAIGLRRIKPENAKVCIFAKRCCFSGRYTRKTKIKHLNIEENSKINKNKNKPTDVNKVSTTKKKQKY